MIPSYFMGKQSRFTNLGGSKVMFLKMLYICSNEELVDIHLNRFD